MRILFMLMGLLLASQAGAGVDGTYRGHYGEQQVSAVLETMSTTVTGVMTIGQAQYLLQAQDNQSVFSGQLNNMSGGAPLALSIRPQGDALNVEIQQPGAAPMKFILNRSR